MTTRILSYLEVLNCPDKRWGSHSFLSNRYREPYPGVVEGCGVTKA